jgi:aminobenzoyl-glutamate transport protein
MASPPRTEPTDRPPRERERGLTRLLGGIERVGNKLPDPFMLFVYLFAAFAVISTVVAALGVTVAVPGADDVLPIRPAFSGEGLLFLLENMVENFVGFPPLGTVLVILLGVGLAERTGLLESAVRGAFSSAPRWLLPYAVAFVGVSANIASDASFVVVPPLAALVFHAAGRHPVAGLICGFASVGSGYSAGAFVASIDALLAGISTEAADALPASESVTVTPVDNYFFSLASALVLPLIAGFLTDKVVEPRLGRYHGGGAGESPDGIEESDHRLAPEARRGLRVAGLAVLAYLVVVVGGALLPGSVLRNDGGGYIPSPLLSGVVPLVFGFFLVAGLAYGITAGSIRSTRDVPRLMTEAVRDLAGYIVLIFAAAQFIALFQWSNMGALIAVKGAQALEGAGLTGFVAIVGFILLASTLNLFIISGSAMWSLLAPVFVPLFFLLGYEPAFIQAAFRIGDSATQIITPMNPYLLVLLGFVRRYEPEAGLGTLISRLIVYVVPFWLVWVGLLGVFVLFGVPVGPGISMLR